MARTQQDHSGFELILANRLHLKELLADGEYTGWTKTFTAGEILVFGEAVYFKAADSKMWLADADAAATMPCIALACEGIAADAAGEFLLWGFIREDDWDYTIGAYLYVHTTGGPPTETMPVGAGDQVQKLGIAETADIIYFCPDLTIVEVA